MHGCTVAIEFACEDASQQASAGRDGVQGRSLHAPRRRPYSVQRGVEKALSGVPGLAGALPHPRLPLAGGAHRQLGSMFTARKKIAKEKGAEPDAFEESVAQVPPFARRLAAAACALSHHRVCSRDEII